MLDIMPMTAIPYNAKISPARRISVASVNTPINTEIKQGDPADAGSPLFLSFGYLQLSHLGNINLAVTIYCVPLRLHRQSNIWICLGGG